MSQNLFARVSGGSISEFPVYLVHIRNRGHSTNLYHPVIVDPLPQISIYEKLSYQLTVEGNTVRQSWVVHAKTLDEVLYDIHEPTRLDPEDPNYQETLDFDTINPLSVQKVVELARLYVGKQLDDFALTRSYENIVSLCSYAASAIEKFRTEAERGVMLRDISWGAIYTYLDQVSMKAVPVPTSSADIDAILPTYTWE